MFPQIESKKEHMKKVPYQSVVGSLMYCMICIRLDIAYSMGVVSQFPIDLGKIHWKALERIFRYLKGTSMLGLPYDGKRNANLVGFAHVDWVGDFDNRRSTSGHCFTLVGVVLVKQETNFHNTFINRSRIYVSYSSSKRSSLAKEITWRLRLSSISCNTFILQ
jgi:hypothetical protein